ncbi:zona pellucida glycoprotein d isoform X2 [Channa argus]|uniref:zona pellucida glycoprotein d isoform X2 n=1 Tax=Channa argus TaxID=215402 RepID=UPI00351FCBDB
MTQIGMKLSVVLVLLGFTRHCVEGICSVEHCTDPSRCVLSKDQRRCNCILGYYADRCDQNAHINVMCGRDYISISAAEDFFKYHNVPLESLHLPNKSCRAQREVIGGVAYYMARLPKDKYLTCGGKLLVKNYTHISYSLSLISDPQVIGNIIRDPVIKMNYTCDYPYIRRVSLPFPLIPFFSEAVIHADEVDITIQMMLYTDHTFTKAFSSAPTIELSDKVYVEVTVREHGDIFLLRVNECWATQTSQPNSTQGSVHTLLLNGFDHPNDLTDHFSSGFTHCQDPPLLLLPISLFRCVNDQTVYFLNGSDGQSGRNGEGSTVRYSFDMFRFTADPPELYLHCTVQLCDREDLISCIPNCNSISKREAVMTDPIQGLLSYGPIRIEMPDRPQFSVLLTVVLIVAGIWTVGFFLIILTTLVKRGNRKLSQIEQ